MSLDSFQSHGSNEWADSRDCSWAVYPGTRVDFGLSYESRDWQACVYFDLAKLPCSNAVPCSDIIPPVLGSIYAKLLSGNFAGSVGNNGDFVATLSSSGWTSGRTGVQGPAAVALAPPGGSVIGEWDPNAWRGPGSQRAAVYERVPASTQQIVSPWDMGVRMRPRCRLSWEDGTRLSASTRAPLILLDRSHVRKDCAWTWGAPLPAQYSAPYVMTWRRPIARRIAWKSTHPIPLQIVSPHVMTWPKSISRLLRHQVTTPALDAPVRVSWLIPGKWKHGAPQWWIPWESARRPPFIWPLPEPEEPEPEPGFHGDPNLVLRCALPDWDACIHYRLDLPQCWAARPCEWGIRRYIVVINTSTFVTLANGTVIPCESLDIRGDLDSWAWGLRAGFRGYPPDALAEEQTEVQATINGLDWTFVLESYDLDRAFGNTQGSVSGRSLSAYLADPYVTARSRIEGTDRTAVQCAEDELYGHDWTLDWGSVDWLIPAGAFSYDAETPMSALKILAAAAGAVVQTHPSLARISVFPRYPVSTWALGSATPDIIIPSDIILSMTKRWEPAPLYRGVWVCGREQGVAVRVLRDGTDGDPYHQQIVEPLVSHIDAARERGRNILCAGGKRVRITLVMPLMLDPGLITPGTIVQVLQSPSWMGYCLGVGVSAQFGQVWQTVEIERVLETP